MSSRNKLVVPGVEQSLNQFKTEMAKEFGLQQHSRNNNQEITQQLLNKANKTKS